MEDTPVDNQNPSSVGVAVERFPVKEKTKGIWRDQVFKRGPDGKDVPVEDTNWKSNVIVVGMPKLIAGLMANEPTFTGGILQHAQGVGDPAWDISLPVPPFNSVKLFAEYFRKAPDSITYLDSIGNPSAVVTNSILIKTTLDYGEANGPGGLGTFIREQGIYGGTATGVQDSGLLANLIWHKARWKDSSVKIIRYIQFIF